jgi:hypothetical protein
MLLNNYGIPKRNQYNKNDEDNFQFFVLKKRRLYLNKSKSF